MAQADNPCIFVVFYVVFIVGTTVYEYSMKALRRGVEIARKKIIEHTGIIIIL